MAQRGTRATASDASLLDKLGVCHRDEGGRVVGSGEQAEVDWVVVEHLGHFAEVSHDNAKGRRHDAEGLLDGHR